MTCDKFEEQVSAVVDNELRDEEMEVLFTHLGTCRTCRQSLRSVLDLRAGLQLQTPPTAPAEMDERILKRMLAVRRSGADRLAIPGYAWHRRISAPMPVAAGIALLLVIGSFLLSTIWFSAPQQSAKESAQAMFLNIVPTVEVRAYELEPMTVTQ
jgi:anti-sigma factor RsiW